MKKYHPVFSGLLGLVVVFLAVLAIVGLLMLVPTLFSVGLLLFAGWLSMATGVPAFGMITFWQAFGLGLMLSTVLGIVCRKNLSQDIINKSGKNGK